MLRTPLNRPASAARLRDSTALIGAIFNADLQIGSALGLAVATAITARVNGTPSTSSSSAAAAASANANANGSAPLGSADFAGYRAAYWFLVGLTAAEAVVAGVFLRGRRRREGLIGEGGTSGEGTAFDVEGEKAGGAGGAGAGEKGGVGGVEAVEAVEEKREV